MKPFDNYNNTISLHESSFVFPSGKTGRQHVGWDAWRNLLGLTAFPFAFYLFFVLRGVCFLLSFIFFLDFIPQISCIILLLSIINYYYLPSLMIANRLYGMIIAIAIAIAISIIVMHLFVFVVVQKKEEVNNSKEFCAQRFLEKPVARFPIYKTVFVFGNTCVHCIGALFPFHICRIGYRHN